MSEKLDLQGSCPTVSDEDGVRPVFSDDYDEFICSGCEASLGDSERDARNAFYNHTIDTERLTDNKLID